MGGDGNPSSPSYPISKCWDSLCNFYQNIPLCTASPVLLCEGLFPTETTWLTTLLHPWNIPCVQLSVFPLACPSLHLLCPGLHSPLLWCQVVDGSLWVPTASPCQAPAHSVSWWSWWSYTSLQNVQVVGLFSTIRHFLLSQRRSLDPQAYLQSPVLQHFAPTYKTMHISLL